MFHAESPVKTETWPEKSLDEVEIPEGMSVILRTAGIGRGPKSSPGTWKTFSESGTLLRRSLLNARHRSLFIRSADAVIRSLRDYMSNDIGEVLIDAPATYKEAIDFVQQVMPHNARKVKLYEDPVPLFTRYQIESQIESAFSHTVTLPLAAAWSSTTQKR